MRLKEALSVMSMASPYAVSTERDIEQKNLHQQIKQYLFIEKAVNQRISSFGVNDKEYRMDDSYLKVNDKLVKIKLTRIK